MQDDFGNPFQGVQVGTCVKSGIKLEFKENLLNAPITSMVTDIQVLKSMSGESDYVYTDQMNQGSGAMSGAWGIDGLAMVSSSLAVYGGKSTANMSKNINIKYTVLTRCGNEFLKFNDLSPEDLVNSLSLSPRKALVEAFDCFVALRDLKSEVLYEAIKDPKSHPEVSTLLQKWIASTSHFFQGFGDGLVVGVVWGGIGQVSLSIENTASTSVRKYGNTANFSYGGIGASWSIKQAYDGGQKTQSANVKVHCDSYYSGSCVAESVENWFKVYSSQAFAQICELRPLDAPEITSKPPEPPSIQPFKKPTPDPHLTDKFGQISSLEGLEAYAIASAYDKLQPDKDGKKMSLDDFIKQYKNPANAGPVQQLNDEVEDNDFDIIVEENDGAMPVGMPRDLSPQTLRKPTADYTALGVWIANWADLFPWLATGCLNDFADIDVVRRQLEKQVMMQDMLTLSRIYYYLAASQISTESLGFQNYDSFETVAVKYQSAMVEIQDNIHKDDAIKRGYAKLDEEAVRSVYDFWRLKAGFLRNAELGLGISIKGTHSVSPNWSRNDYTGDCPTIYYKAMKCPRPVAGGNDVFRQCLKGIPVIAGKSLNDERGESAHPVYLFGPANMLLKSFLFDGEMGEIGFSRDPALAMKFAPEHAVDSRENKLSYLSREDVNLYPIRYSDVKAGDGWIGQTVSANVGANGALRKQLEMVMNRIRGLNALSLSSSTWDQQAKGQVKWSPIDPYVQSAVPLHFVGIVPEPANL